MPVSLFALQPGNHLFGRIRLTCGMMAKDCEHRCFWQRQGVSELQHGKLEFIKAKGKMINRK